METPKELRYTNTHEWIRIEGNKATVGITDFAQAQLGDLTFVELPAVGDEVAAQEETGVVESVKAASDIYAPLTGKISAINDDLVDNPEWINEDPFGQGWMFTIEFSNAEEIDNLLDADAYEEVAPDEG